MRANGRFRACQPAGAARSPWCLLTRRSFLRGTLAAGLAAACGDGGGGALDGGSLDPIIPAPGDPDAEPPPEPDAAPPPEPDATAAEVCPDDPLAGGMMIGTVELLDSGSPSYG